MTSTCRDLRARARTATFCRSGLRWLKGVLACRRIDLATTVNCAALLLLGFYVTIAGGIALLPGMDPLARLVALGGATFAAVGTVAALGLFVPRPDGPAT